jgi:hypothetical protein
MKSADCAGDPCLDSSGLMQNHGRKYSQNLMRCTLLEFPHVPNVGLHFNECILIFGCKTSKHNLQWILASVHRVTKGTETGRQPHTCIACRGGFKRLMGSSIQHPGSLMGRGAALWVRWAPWPPPLPPPSPQWMAYATRPAPCTGPVRQSPIVHSA